MKKAFMTEVESDAVGLSGSVCRHESRIKAGNHCNDRRNEHYNRRKNQCKSLPYKHERQRCEDEVKRDKDECRRR